MKMTNLLPKAWQESEAVEFDRQTLCDCIEANGKHR